MQRILLALTFLLLAAVTCPAGQHPLTVTRTADDFYAAFDRDILIKTRFCFAQAFQERALLHSGGFDELVFTDGTRCSVDTVYARTHLRRGSITSLSLAKRRESTVWRAPKRCSSRRGVPLWPCGTKPCWRCGTAFPVYCICMAALAGWRASSRPFRIDAGPPCFV